MALPELVRISALRKVNELCERRVPEFARDQLRLESRVRGDAITIVERRAPWREDFGPEWTEGKVAQLRFHSATRTWELFAFDRNQRRIAYPFATPARDLDVLLAELDSDPICIFWG
jgi:hypothetical protein